MSLFFSDFFVLQKAVVQAIQGNRKILTYDVLFQSLPLLA